MVELIHGQALCAFHEPIDSLLTVSIPSLDFPVEPGRDTQNAEKEEDTDGRRVLLNLLWEPLLVNETKLEVVRGKSIDTFFDDVDLWQKGPLVFPLGQFGTDESILNDWRDDGLPLDPGSLGLWPPVSSLPRMAELSVLVGVASGGKVAIVWCQSKRSPIAGKEYRLPVPFFRHTSFKARCARWGFVM